MSEVSGYVLLKKDDLVSTRRWREAIAAHGFALDLLDDVDWTNETGRVRCRYFGEDSHFEYALAPLEQGWLERAEIKMGIGGRGDADTLVTFSSSAESGSEWFATVPDFLAMAVAFIAGAALAEVTGGRLADDAHELAADPDMAVAYGRYFEQSIMQFIYERNFDTQMFMPTPREIMPVLQSRRLQAVIARQVEIFGAIFKDWKRSEAQIAELAMLDRELREITDESEAIPGATGLRAWRAQGRAGLANGNERDKVG